MEMVMTSSFWVILAQITMINILLSGDNAVVIALASRSLPPRQQKQAVLFGSFGAIILRVILTFFAVYLLDLPFLKIVGALLLIWIGIKMLIPQQEEAHLDAHSNLWAAVKTIIIADFVMSLDNVLGVAAAAKGNVALLVIGLVISIPLIIYGSTLVLKLMNRFSFIVTAGGGLLGWVAGEMLVSDPAISLFVDTQLPWAHTGGPVLATLAVIGTGKWFSWNSAGTPAVEPEPELALATAQSGVEMAVAPAASDAYSVAQAHPSAGLRAGAEGSSPSISARTAIEIHAAQDDAPAGYRWVSSQWHIRPDGSRDYAAMHGLKSFRSLVPASSHLQPAPHSIKRAD